MFLLFNRIHTKPQLEVSISGFLRRKANRWLFPAHGTNCGSVWPMATLALLCRYRRTASSPEAVVLTAKQGLTCVSEDLNTAQNIGKRCTDKSSHIDWYSFCIASDKLARADVTQSLMPRWHIKPPYPHDTHRGAL